MFAFLFLLSAMITAHALPEKNFVGSLPITGVPSRFYPGHAKISMDSAIQSALRANPGKLHSALLEAENGYLVYAVAIDSTAGMNETIVDAGNGKILSPKSSGDLKATNPLPTPFPTPLGPITR